MKILFFYPEDPLAKTQGNNARALALLTYFKEKGYLVDFVCHDSHIRGKITPETIKALKEEGLIEKGTILSRRKRSGVKYLLHSLKYKLKGIFTNYNKEFDRVRFGQLEEFNAFVSGNTYDVAIITYVYYYKFLEAKHLNAKTKIVDTHDFITAQFKDSKYFNDEIKTLNLFDKIWSISLEEQFVFSQFLKDKVHLIPHAVEVNKNSIKSEQKEIDVIYVAGDNPHNIKAINWFFEEVYNLLPTDINITIIGKICRVIPEKPNITKIEFVEDLSSYYQKSKVAMCPMLSGTGVKIKVVEALAYNIPVVCNVRGVDGLLNKTNNGCLVSNDPKQFANYLTDLVSNIEFHSNQAEKAKQFYNETLSEVSVKQELDAFFQSIN